MAKVLNVYRGDGLNLYAYVKNNPIMWVDPSGYMAHDPNAKNPNANNNFLSNGNSTPPNNSTPNTIYEQINPDGTVKSRSFYDDNGREIIRQDFDHEHFDKQIYSLHLMNIPTHIMNIMDMLIEKK